MDVTGEVREPSLQFMSKPTQPCLDARERASALRDLDGAEFDLVVIGGGITGAGILRDAALRGLSVALLEAEDFSSGTSSKSTKLIHGGIRYLAMGHVHVVREAARERKRVNRIAPHLAEPKWLTLPARNRLEWLKYKVGVILYEKLGQVAEPDLHFDVSGAALERHEPLLDRHAYPLACVYREYLTDDSRLVIGNVRAGVRAGGIAFNRLPVTGLIKDYGRVTGVRARCRVTGEEVLVRGKAVINAAGPWVESVCEFDGLNPPKSMVLSKGVHIVVSRERLPLSQVVLTVADDKRPVFVIPRGDVVYIGTTDTRYPAGADLWPEVLPEEIEYLFGPVAKYFRTTLTDRDCLASWAGLRPLIQQPGKSTREISRRDEVWISQSGLITIAGGKLTGYRKMAEDTVDVACRQLQCNRPEPSIDEPLPGGDFDGTTADLAARLSARFALDLAQAGRLSALYGAEVSDVLAHGNAPVAEGADIVEGEIHWAMRQEGASSIEDVLYRRLRAAYYSPQQVGIVVEPVARIMADTLGWSEARTREEVDSVTQRLAIDHVGVGLRRLSAESA